MNNLEAIKQLESAFKHNPEYKGKWQDYIELAIMEAFDDQAPHVGKNAVKNVVNDAAKKILRLFDTAWWEAQR